MSSVSRLLLFAVSCRVHDAASRQAHELRCGVAERTTAVSHEATGMYSSHPRAAIHVLHSSGGLAGLPVTVSVGDDCLQLLLLHVPWSTAASGSCVVSITHTHAHTSGRLWRSPAEVRSRQSRPIKAGLKCSSVRTYVRTSVRPQKVSSVLVKFGM